jgi:hypothetical protein
MSTIIHTIPCGGIPLKATLTVNKAGNIGWRECTHFGISPHQVGATQNHFLIQKLCFGWQHHQRKIFSSQEDAIIIAKSENACADDMLLEDDIPEDFSIKMHTGTIKDSSAYQHLTSKI